MHQPEGSGGIPKKIMADFWLGSLGNIYVFPRDMVDLDSENQKISMKL
jgi:hypothetical protein